MRDDVKVMQKMVDTMVGIPQFSYPARQNNAPKPADEFAHIRLIEEYPVGIPKNLLKEQDDLTTTHRIHSPTLLRFRIGVVDTNGLPSSKIMHGWTSEAMKAIMLDTGYGFVRCTPLSSEDKKLENEWEFRTGFSVELYATRVYEEVIDNITQMQIKGEYVDNEAVLDMTIDVNE